jgi:hypothetical protein
MTLIEVATLQMRRRWADNEAIITAMENGSLSGSAERIRTLRIINAEFNKLLASCPEIR